MSIAEQCERWDAVETAERIAKREISAREVIEAAIARAERAEHLGAIVTPTFDSARRAAISGPWGGVPTFIKDLAQVRGVRTTWGSAAAGYYVSSRTDPSLRRFFGTGLVSLGKSATPELGLTATTEPLGRAPCRNAWDPTRSSGGSSGGAGTLVAAGVVPVAHASDGGGSIRIPAACNGVVGLKPTRRRFDMDGASFLPVNVAVQGIISRTVRDTVAFYRALEAQGSPIAPIGPVRPEPAAPLRIAVYTDAPMGTPVDPEHRRAAEATAALCASLGHHVEAIACPFPAQRIEDFLRFWGGLGYLYLRAGKLFTHRGLRTEQLEPWTQEIGRYFRRELGTSVRAIVRLRHLDRLYARVMTKYDVLICPTLGEPPPPLGHLRTDQPFELGFARLMRFAAFTPVQNAAGAPAISLPMGRTTSGLPIGVQLAGRSGQDGLLLELASSLEAAQPWELISPASRWHAASAA